MVSKKDKACTDGINKILPKIKSNYFMILGSDDVISDKNYIKNLLKPLKENKCDIILPQWSYKNNIKKSFPIKQF